MTIDTLSPNKLNTLINYISPEIYEIIAECPDYPSAISKLESVFVKPQNEVFARHLLITRRQDNDETIDQYLQSLTRMARECEFKAVTLEKCRDDYVRDAFINGLRSAYIRRRLLENNVTDLKTVFEHARALELAQKNAETYEHLTVHSSIVAPVTLDTSGDSTRPLNETCQQKTPTLAVVSTPPAKCFFCGYAKHPRSKCPARNATCNNCGKKGHFRQVCRSEKMSAALPHLGAICQSVPKSLSRATVQLKVNGRQTEALLDTGSSESFISQELVNSQNWVTTPDPGRISMAAKSLKADIIGKCLVNIELNGELYSNVKLMVLPALCADILLGHDFLKLHKGIEILFGGSRPTLSVCGLTAMDITPPSLFAYLRDDCKPIATKSRRHSLNDTEFIKSEIQRLIHDDVIEPSTSPWRAQVLVTTNERQKKRMVIDYSQTINKYTLLDAYPLPNISEMINNIAQYRIFSTLDLKSAYHQIPILEEERQYTAFEALGKLYHFKRIPFGVTNGVACFQRIMNNIIENEGLDGTFAYLDNVTICGHSQEEHDKALQAFLRAASKYRITFNEGKSIISSETINLLGYQVSRGLIKPDPERLRPLQEMAIPKNKAALRRVIGLFSYYSNWIAKFSDKVQPLVRTTTFPLSDEAKSAFNQLKSDVKNSVITTIDERIPFSVETDASDIAIAATLNQAGRPVAFFSRTLSPTERRHSSVEKEAYAIVEALRKWRHFLLGRHFKLVTDQRSVSYMFDQRASGKVKNDKIQRWRIELSNYSFDIMYRPGKSNVAADTFTRISCSVGESETLVNLHISLCHPGITRMLHFVRCRNLPYSVDDVKRMTKNCSVCSELKPRYHKPATVGLIKATAPFERLNIDFKGPLPSLTKNKYILTIIDEFSRFPFAYACTDTSSRSVIQCLCHLFSIFGMPSYVHSDRGTSFMSSDIKNFLHGKGIATSRTTAYNPTGNSQVERFNGIIWKTISLCLKSRNLSIGRWEEVLLDSLHSIRSLLCTATNCTPHERFFSYQRKSTSGQSIPTWLSIPGPVLLKRHLRQSKYEPLVDEVELLEANPSYAHVRLQDGRETTVSVRHLAPLAPTPESEGSPEFHSTPSDNNDNSPAEEGNHEDDHMSEQPRRSERIRRPPDRLTYE